MNISLRLQNSLRPFMFSDNVCIALIQSSCSTDISANIHNSCEMIRQAAKKSARIILLQELFNCPYFCREIDDRYFDWAEPVPGPTTAILQKLALELGVVIVAPLFEKRAAGIYHNTAAVIDADGTYVGKYRKMHIPEDPGFHEKFYFTPGDLGYRVFDTRFGRIGVLICWDQWFPEAARITALHGAQLLVFPTAIASLPDESGPVAKKYMEAWQTIQRSHAIANGCYVAAVNRTGMEGPLDFWGRSFLCGPMGEIIGECQQEPSATCLTANLSSLDRVRTTWPFLRDRRIDSYQPVASRWMDSSEGRVHPPV